MEASALPRTAGLRRTRLSVATPRLRLRSDEQLVALFRAGSEEAFRAIHERYRARLLAYSRQMLGGSSADAEDAMQDVFVRVYSSLRENTRPISLRAWLYRIAHNRCVDEIRRPRPVPSEIHPAAELALSRGARHDPPVAAQLSEDLARLVADVRALPEQQRSALLMRELQGLTYHELGVALGISVPAVKSLLLRARTGLIDATLAREAPCETIRAGLLAAHERGVRAGGRARRHMRECAECAGYRGKLAAIRRDIAALVPSGPLGHLGVLFGVGGGGASAGGGLAAGGGGAAAVGGVAASKVAAIVCCAALLGSAGTALHREVTAAVHQPTSARSAGRPAPSASTSASASVAGSRAAAPAWRPAASYHAPAERAVGRAHKTPDAQPLTGQDMVYDAPSAASGVNSALTQTGGTSAGPDTTGTPTSAADGAPTSGVASAPQPSVPVPAATATSSGAVASTPVPR